MDSLIVIRTYENGQLAHLDAAKLADEGIESSLQDEHTAMMMPHLSYAMGGVKLMVKESDGERAMDILEQVDGRSDSPIEVAESERTDKCPKCGSTEYALKGSIFTIIASLLFGMATASTIRRRVCAQCGHSWL